MIAFTSWTYMARIIRGQVLSLREKEFIEAARSMGASNTRIIFRELLPNLTAPIIVYASILIPQVILYEAALSFLGVGVTDQPSWGQMISDATPIFSDAWWYMLFPGLALLFTVLAFNLVGDAMQDALNPARRRLELDRCKLKNDVPPTERTDDANQAALAACAGRHRRSGAGRFGVRQRRQRRRELEQPANGEVRPADRGPDDAQQGGDLTVLAAGDVDYIDPGAAYYQFTYMVTSATQRASRPTRPTTSRSRRRPAGDRAPTVSDDGKTITYTLRDDVKYSPPARWRSSWKPRAATAADVKYAIERVAAARACRTATCQTYLAGVDGIDKAVKEAQDNPTGGAPDISGITAPDDTTLVIKLDQHERRSA